jgi:hypothetical protein
MRLARDGLHSHAAISLTLWNTHKVMSIPTRRTFLFALSSLPCSLPVMGAAKRRTYVLADVGESAAAIEGAGFDGLIRTAQDARALPAKGIRAPLPRFEDSMDDAASELKTLAEKASAHGAEALIATHPGLSGNGAFRPVDLERKARMLGIAGSICANRGLTFLYQNQSLEFTGNAVEERALMARTDPKQVSYLLDAGEAMRGGADAAAFFEANQKRIGGLLLTDFKDDGLVPFGQGNLAASAIAAAMRKGHWSGWLVVPLNRVPAENFKATRELIRKVFGA